MQKFVNSIWTSKMGLDFGIHRSFGSLYVKLKKKKNGAFRLPIPNFLMFLATKNETKKCKLDISYKKVNRSGWFPTRCVRRALNLYESVTSNSVWRSRTRPGFRSAPGSIKWRSLSNWFPRPANCINHELQVTFFFSGCRNTEPSCCKHFPWCKNVWQWMHALKHL